MNTKDSKGNQIRTKDSTNYEKSLMKLGLCVIPYQVSSLRSAVKEDIREILFTLAQHASDDGCLDWLNVEQNQMTLCSQLGKALDYIVKDLEPVDEVYGSYEFGVDRILDLAEIRMLDRCGESGSDLCPAHRMKSIIHQINASLISLMARGQVQQAFDLARFGGALGSLESLDNNMKNDSIKQGHSRKISKRMEQWRILKVVIYFLNRGQAPDKREVRIAHNSGIDEARFSRLIANMHIGSVLRNAPTHPEKRTAPIVEQGRLKDTINNLSESEVTTPRFRLRYDDLNEVLTRTQQSLRPSGDPDMADCEIRRIKESLGPVYSLLLIQFGMAELEEADDLDEFVQCLSKIGLGLR